MKKRQTRYPGVRWHDDALYYRVMLACGKRAEIRFGQGTPKDAFLAREERQELESKIRNHRIDPRQESIERQSARPAKDVLAEYVDHLRGKNRDGGHVKNTENFIRKGLAACGAKRILEIDAHKVNEWLRGLGLSARSKNARRTAMLAFCRWAADFGRVPRNPLPSGLVPTFDENADRRRAGLIGSDNDPDAGYVDARGRRLDRKCLRMSFCTWLKRGGVDLRDAQRLMRHSDPRLTSNVYSDLRVADLRAAVAKGLGGSVSATPATEARTA